MDFFEHQDAARRRTGRLVFLFLLAVVAIVLAVYLVVALAVHPSWDMSVEDHGSIRLGPRVWDPSLFAIVSLATVVVIAAGSLYKIAELSGGGELVALSLGGRRIDPMTRDPAERRLLNVVEEMALAAGMAVPPVYVLDDEPSINAFAAGHTPQNAVVAVSQGCLTHLTRDELQGVMGHEFSHILNGDMRLNIRLIGILNGILLLAIIGYYVLRIGPVRTERSDKKEGGGLWLVVIGLGLLAIGYVGLFFAKLIRASVSRQREYLADASAVQFTRLPSGIAGALKKIGGLERGSTIRDAHADEVSHMFFGDSAAMRFFGFFATHPPLAERIHRIDPTFDGKFPPTAAIDEGASPVETSDGPHKQRFVADGTRGRLAAAGTSASAAARGQAAMLGQIGVMAPANLAYAAALIDQTPTPLAAAVAEPYGARAVVYAMLLNREEEIRATQLALLKSRAEDLSYRETVKLATLVDAIPEAARLPLIDRAFPALKQLSPAQYDAFRGHVEALVRADGKISLLEYVIQTMLFRTLDVHFGKSAPPRIEYYSIQGVIEPLVAVLSTVAYAGSSNAEEIQRAFHRGMNNLGRAADVLPRDRCTLAAFDAALTEMTKTAPKVKRQIIAACAACIAADGIVTVREGELLRAITAMLGCPMPPLAATVEAAGR